MHAWTKIRVCAREAVGTVRYVVGKMRVGRTLARAGRRFRAAKECTTSVRQVRDMLSRVGSKHEASATHWKYGTKDYFMRVHNRSYGNRIAVNGCGAHIRQCGSEFLVSMQLRQALLCPLPSVHKTGAW